MESTILVGDSINRVAGWLTKPDLEALAGQAVRFRFVMKDADLYALRFQ
jgi:hypothetical protein